MLFALALQLVEKLDEELFQEVIADKRPIMVKFYAPWCGHCKDLAPKFAELSERESPVRFGEVDCTEHGDLCAGE